VAGDGDRGRQDGAGTQQLHVQRDGLLGVDDGFRGQRRVITTDEVGESATEIRVGEEVRTAIGVVDDGDLEPGAPGVHCLGQVADVGEIGKHVRGDAAACVADHHRIPEPEFEERRRVGAWVQAGDHVHRVFRNDAGALAGGRGREVLVALQERIDVSHGQVLPE
jgi:hypothetical protein